MAAVYFGSQRGEIYGEKRQLSNKPHINLRQGWSGQQGSLPLELISIQKFDNWGGTGVLPSFEVKSHLLVVLAELSKQTS